MADRITAPAGLGRRGRAFWRDVTAVWELRRDERELLTEICRILDELDAGELSPAQRTPARSLLGRLLAQLGLPDEDGASVPSPRSVRAQKAAQSRWAGHTKRSEQHGA